MAPRPTTARTSGRTVRNEKQACEDPKDTKRGGRGCLEQAGIVAL
jgi:hypothetical protein